MKRSFTKIWTIFLALLVMTFSVIGVAPAHALTFTVTTLTDGGAGSLRQAITAANANLGIADTITFSVNGTIILGTELPAISDVAGLTIDGTGQTVTISGNDSTQVIWINPGVPLTVKNMTISHGNASSLDGGAIYNNGTLSIVNSTFSNNRTTGNGTKGGGIYTNSTLTITGSKFISNSASGSSSNGGGLYIAGGTASITNSALSFSTAALYGAAIYNKGALTITNSNFLANSADVGGAIYTDNSLTITKSSFLANSAADGAAISNTGLLTIANSTLVGNTASSYGGGIYNADTLNITNSDFYNNTAKAGATAGAAIYNALGSTAILANTILATSHTAGNCGGSITNGGNNIEDGTTCAWSSALGSMSNTNPLLGALIGSPAYFPLNPGSPALDAGDDSACITAPVNRESQNGLTRPQGARCDIGSYEAIAYYNLPVNSSAAQDGWVLESSETSNKGGTMNAAAKTFNLGDDAMKKQYRGVLSFDTGTGLPDTAVITAVTLKIKRNAVVGGGNPVTMFKGFMLDIKNGSFGTPALQVSDFQAAASQTLGPFTPALVSGWYSIDLTSAQASINKLATSGGLTQIRLRFKLDDNNNAVANYLRLFSGNAPVANSPQLIIQYYVP